MNKQKEPTQEELSELLDTWKHACEKDCLTECCIEFKESVCVPCFKIIRRLIENMDKMMFREKLAKLVGKQEVLEWLVEKLEGETEN